MRLVLVSPIRIINDVEKSLSGVEGRLHDEETNNRATNTEFAVTKNYHKYESHDSAKVNYSTNKLQKVSEDDRRKSTVRSNVSFRSKYLMRKSSNKSLNESPRQSRKGDIPCHIFLEEVGVLNQTDVIAPTKIIVDNQV